MRDFLKRVSPKRAVTDFRDHWQQPTPHRWQVLGVAVAATFFVFMMFIPDSQRPAPERPDIYYISTLDEARREQEIIAANCANQELKDAIQARLDANAQRRQEMYEALGRATFVDVDEMQARIEEERAAEAAAAPPEAETVAEGPSVEEYCARATG